MKHTEEQTRLVFIRDASVMMNIKVVMHQTVALQQLSGLLFVRERE